MMKISVIGLGKLGLPILQVFKKHFKVIGIDKIQKRGFTTSFENLGDISFVIVPTPSLQNHQFNSQYVEEVLSQIKQKHIVVIVSTVMPGEIDRLQNNYPHLTLIYNPTFVALGTVKYDFTHPDFVLIGGDDKKAIKLLKSIYKVIVKDPKFAILAPLEAEIAKLTLNCYITTKITFANQIGNLCHRLRIKPNNILNAVGMDSRVGNKYFKSGLGYGGPCFPRDNLALSAFMKDNQLFPDLFETIHNCNNQQIKEIVQRIIQLSPKTIGFSGLSYKQKTKIEECSQLKEIYEILKNSGYKVKIGKGDVNLNWSGICQK